jgi:isocitrate dehydrogenase
MMLQYLGWEEAAIMVEKAIEKTISSKVVTYDLERQMTGATKVKTSEFATKVIENMR